MQSDAAPTYQAVLTADGRWLVEGGAGVVLAERLGQALEGGTGELLWLLGTDLVAVELGPEWRWLRRWAIRFLERLCQGQGKAGAVSEEEATTWLAEAPLFQGAEHLRVSWAMEWWDALADGVARWRGGDESFEAWLKKAAPQWHAVGKVTFHLAENPTDGQRPFAFLATYADGLGDAGQARHLPLKRAVQAAVERRDQAVLERLLEPVRRAAERSELVAHWLQSKRLFQPLALTAGEAYGLLLAGALLKESGVVVKVPDWWKKGRGLRPVAQLSLETPGGNGRLGAGALMAFRVRATLNGERLTEAEWQTLMEAGTGLVSLRGQWVEVDAPKLRQVLAHWERVEAAAGEQGMGFIEGMRLLAGWTPQAEAAAGGGPLPLADWSEVVSGPSLREQLEALREPGRVAPPAGLRAVLRPYQQRGFEWLALLTGLGLGACLADDMGLGKTLQVVALLVHRAERARGEEGASRKPTLLVVPASLLGNWRAEVERFAPQLRLWVGHPSMTAREEMSRILAEPEHMGRGRDVVVTTYALVQRLPAWEQVHWGLVVLDEAQAIKNAGSQAAQAVKRLRCDARVALTGTPVENRPGDLWSLFDFLNPGLLGSAGEFQEVVKRCGEAREGFAPLRRLIQPYLLRRMKTDPRIIGDLPEKIEVKAWCGLTKRQLAVYAKLVEQLGAMLRDPNLDPVRRKGLVLGFLIKFKQICNHPSHWSGDGVWAAEDSGKFLRLSELAVQAAERRERMLVFTQFQEVCGPLERLLRSAFGREGLVLHGGTAVRKRAELVKAFQAPDGPPFMVLSVKAGGTGLNLTAASQVVHFDRWWNPAVENQATDRAYRIGQRRAVVVHKMICQGTLEARIDRMLEEKSALAEDLLREDGAGAGFLLDLDAEALLDVVRLDARQALL